MLKHKKDKAKVKRPDCIIKSQQEIVQVEILSESKIALIQGNQLNLHRTEVQLVENDKFKKEIQLDSN